MNRSVRMLLPCALAGLMTGCAASQPTTRTFAYLRLTGVSRAQAFDAAVQAMGERFVLASVEPATGTIKSVPQESDEPGSQGRVGDVVGVSRRVRRVATAQVTGTEDAAEVWCKIVVEQYETNEQQLFTADRSIDDMPTGTAADRGGAVTAEQNSVWRTIRRDKPAERAVLQAVDELVHKSGAPDAKKVTSQPG